MLNYLFLCQLSRDILVGCLPFLVNMLKAKSTVVHTYASYAIERIFTLKTPGGGSPWVFSCFFKHCTCICFFLFNEWLSFKVRSCIFHILSVHQPFYILVCISTLPTRHRLYWSYFLSPCSSIVRASQWSSEGYRMYTNWMKPSLIISNVGIHTK